MKKDNIDNVINLTEFRNKKNNVQNNYYCPTKELILNECLGNILEILNKNDYDVHNDNLHLDLVNIFYNLERIVYNTEYQK